MQKRRRGRRRAGNLNAIMQSARDQLVVGEHFVPVMDQAGGSGIKAVDAVYLG